MDKTVHLCLLFSLSLAAPYSLGDKAKSWQGFSSEPLAVEHADLADDDGDGVVNHRDRCPGTAKGVVVDDSGCEQNQSKIASRNLNIHFADNQTDVEEKYLREIQTLAEEFKASGAHLLLIEGHTDRTGGKQYNVDLSLARARAVAHSLVSRFGVPAEQVMVSGQGFKYQVASNETANGRALNRRMIAYYTYDDRASRLEWNIWSVNVHKERNSQDIRQFQRLGE